MNKKMKAGSYEFHVVIPNKDDALDSFIQASFPIDFIRDKDTDEPYANIDIYGGIV